MVFQSTYVAVPTHTLTFPETESLGSGSQSIKVHREFAADISAEVKTGEKIGRAKRNDQRRKTGIKKKD